MQLAASGLNEVEETGTLFGGGGGPKGVGSGQSRS